MAELILLMYQLLITIAAPVPIIYLVPHSIYCLQKYRACTINMAAL